MTEKEVWVELAEACEKAFKDCKCFVVRGRQVVGLCDGLKVILDLDDFHPTDAYDAKWSLYKDLKKKLPLPDMDTEWGWFNYCWPVGDHAARAVFCRKMIAKLEDKNEG